MSDRGSRSPPPSQRPRVVVGSSVGGGPMERLARRLRDRGRDARVLSGLTNARWRALMGSGPLGRLQARLTTYLHYPLQALRDALGVEPAVLVPTTNPFFLPFVLVATRPLHGKRVVPLVYDLYPDAFEATGARGVGLVGQLASAANRYWFRRADALVFIGRRMGEHARARYGEPRRFAVIETGADSEELEPTAIRRSAPETPLEEWCQGRLVLSYVGNMGRVHDWETLAAAVPRLVSRLPDPTRLAIVIAASGPGVEALQRAWRDLPEGIVRFEGPVPDREWARLLARTDVALVTLREEANRTSIPSKALSAMAGGNAIVAICPRDSDLADLLLEHGCGHVIAPGDTGALVEALQRLATDRVSVERLRKRARKAAVERYDLRYLAERWDELLVEVESRRPDDPELDRLRRIIDFTAAALGIAVCGPVLIGGALAIAATTGTPVLFRQSRPGKDGEPFELAKFRTMRDPKPHERGPEYDAARMTRVGRLLRTTSIDELPTLFNVLKGDMSLVGPRPLLMRYLPRYSPEEARRHDVLPGITGWAQVNGRNRIGWAEKFALDVWYTKNRSLALDLRILAATIGKVLGRHDIDQEAGMTMPEFMGHTAPAAPSDTAEGDGC